MPNQSAGHVIAPILAVLALGVGTRTAPRRAIKGIAPGILWLNHGVDVEALALGCDDRVVSGRGRGSTPAVIAPLILDGPLAKRAVSGEVEPTWKVGGRWRQRRRRLRQWGRRCRGGVGTGEVHH